MEFEWDPAKNDRNIREHGMDFDLAVHALKHILDNKEDMRHEYGETRMVAKCLYEKKIVIVVYTMRSDELCRIISVRRANKREKRGYEKEKIQKNHRAAHGSL